MPSLGVRSRGTSPKARRTVRREDIEWADLVLVMEGDHRRRLKAQYPQEMAHKPTHVLDIPDEYGFMDPELVDLLEASVRPLLGLDGES